MLNFLKPVSLYIRMAKDQIRVLNLNNGQSTERSARSPFSNDRLIIADYEKAEEELQAAISEVVESGVIPPALKIVFQIVDDRIHEITPVERRTYLDSCMHAGAKQVVICEHERALTDAEALELLKRKTNPNAISRA